MPSTAALTRGARLRRYLVVNVVAIWVSVLGLLVLLAAGPSRTLVQTIITLACGGTLVLLALWLASRERTVGAAAVVIGATWLVALGITWLSPFVTPIGLLALLLPLVIVADHLPRRLR